MALRHRRPEDLPVPYDGDLESEVTHLSVAGGVGGVGKGRGQAAGSGRLFVTPPSRRSEGRGQRGIRQSEGTMPEEQPSGKPLRSHSKTMGPVPPESQPPASASTSMSRKAAEESEGGLQRALEAEMVLFLQEQNAKLMAEVELLRGGNSSKESLGAMSTPSSWEAVDGAGGGKSSGGQEAKSNAHHGHLHGLDYQDHQGHVHEKGSHHGHHHGPDHGDYHVHGSHGGTHQPSATMNSEPGPPQTPRGRSPTTRLLRPAHRMVHTEWYSGPKRATS